MRYVNLLVLTSQSNLYTLGKDIFYVMALWVDVRVLLKKPAIIMVDNSCIDLHDGTEGTTISHAFSTEFYCS